MLITLTVFQVNWMRRGLLRLIWGQFTTTQHEAATRFFLVNSQKECFQLRLCLFQYLWRCRGLHPVHHLLLKTSQRERETPRQRAWERKRARGRQQEQETQLLWETTRRRSPGDKTNTDTLVFIYLFIIIINGWILLSVCLSVSLCACLQVMEVDTGKSLNLFFEVVIRIKMSSQ